MFKITKSVIDFQKKVSKLHKQKLIDREQEYIETMEAEGKEINHNFKKKKPRKTKHKQL